MDESIRLLLQIFGLVATLAIAWLARRIQVLTAQHQPLADVRRWADEAVDVLTEALYLVREPPPSLSQEDAAKQRHACRRRISALVERGRWLVPNEFDPAKGAGRGPAYEGHRPEVLDALLAAHDVLGEPGPADAVAVLRASRKAFVNAVHAMLAPRERARAIRAILGTAPIPVAAGELDEFQREVQAFRDARRGAKKAA